MIRSTNRSLPVLIAGALTVIASLLAPGELVAIDPRYEEIREASDIVEKHGDHLPLDLEFTDSEGVTRRLGDLLRPERPVILTLAYYDCPMLCHLVLDGMVSALRKHELRNWGAGDQFDILTVSIDPEQTPEVSAKWKAKYLESYIRPTAAQGWKFLTGDKPTLRALADSVGFGYMWVDERKEFAHKGALIICTPDGKVSQYLHGVSFKPNDVKLALMDAADGEIGSFLDQVQFFCYRWDPEQGKYTRDVFALMQLGGLVTVIGLVAMILLLRRSEPKHDLVTAGTTESQGTAPNSGVEK